MEEVQRDPSLLPLSFLIGNWQTEGEVLGTSNSHELKIKGTDSYEWSLDGKFIMHKASVMMGDVPTEVIEFIGSHETKKDTYELRSFDNSGVFTTMLGSMNSGDFLITGGNMRSKLTPHREGGSMNAHWERSDDGKNWVPWMNLAFKKVS